MTAAAIRQLLEVFLNEKNIRKDKEKEENG
jgi:hypothetical protein